MTESALSNDFGPVWHKIVDKLYLGSFEAAYQDVPPGVSLVISLMEDDWTEREYQKLHKDQLEVVWLEFSDIYYEPDRKSMEIFARVNEIIKNNSDKNILVHCMRGQSRSAAAVLYHLMMEHNMSYEEALEHILDIRWQCEYMNPVFARQLHEEYNKTV